MTVLPIINQHKLGISIFTVWLFHISAIIGIESGYQDWFLPLTPLNLLMCLIVIVWNLPNPTLKDCILLGIPFVIGMVAEILGVNYGLIFGSYAYGENLGPKILGVPITIGMNWTILVFITASIAEHWTKNKLLASLMSSGMMVLLDLLIEVVAPKFDFWEFEGGIVPIQNYIGWFSVALVAQLIHLHFFKKHHFKLSIGIFWAFILFFGIFAR
jgi:putative membrane protein